MHRNPASIASVYMIMTMHFDQELVRTLPRRPWIVSTSIGAPVDLINCACRGMPSGHLTCLGQSWEESATAQVRVKCLHERTARIDRKEAQRKRHPRAQLRQGNRWLAESTAPRDCDPRPFPALASHFPVHAELSSPTASIDHDSRHPCPLGGEVQSGNWEDQNGHRVGQIAPAGIPCEATQSAIEPTFV
jgi:hypothetical protein